MATPESVSASLVWTNAVWPLLVALLVAISATGVGVGLLALACRTRRLLTAFELTVAPALGLAAIGYAADLLFMTGVVDMRPVYIALTMIGVGLLVWQRRRLPVFRFSFDWPPGDRLFWVAGWMVVVWFGWKLYVGNVTPVNENDSIYHYAFYSRLLASGVNFQEALLLRNFPLTDLNRIIQHCFALAGTIGGENALHLVNFLFVIGIGLIAQGLAAGVMRVTRWNDPLPILAVITLREIIYTGFSAKLDYGVALLELVAAALFLTWRDRRTWILPVALGLALCARTNTLRFAVVIPLIWIVDQWWSRREAEPLRTVAIRTLAVGAGTVLIAIPPFAMQQFLYGNPFYPMLNGLFGEYRHYYDWVILDSLRYRTDYGWLGLFAVFAAVALQNLCTVPGVTTPGNTPWGLSALMLLAPLALKRDRNVLWLGAFVALGYVTWYTQTNTHRTLLSVAVVAVVLAAALISRLRTCELALHFGLYIVVIALALWTARGFLGFNDLHLNHHYVAGRWTDAEYHDRMVRKLYEGVPNASEVAAIKRIVGGSTLASVNLTPFAHPELIRTRRLLIAESPMATIAQSNDVDPMDRRIAKELLESPYIQRQATELFDRIWPADERQRPLQGIDDLRWYLRASFDASRWLGDAIADDPRRLAPLMRFERVQFVLARKETFSGPFPPQGLDQVWASDSLVLLRVAPAPSRPRAMDPWAETASPYRQRVTIPTGIVAGDLVEFPVAVRKSLSDATFWRHATSSNAIRFTDVAGRPLAFEIEEFDTVAKSFVAWVMIPRVSASAATEFYLYYGGESRPVNQSLVVWDEKYVAVFHGGTLPPQTPGALRLRDSSRSGHHAVGDGALGVSVGRLGSGVLLQGTDGVLSIPRSRNWTFGPDDWTVEFWLKKDGATAGAGAGILSHGLGSAFHLYYHAGNFFVLEQRVGDVVKDISFTGSTLPEGEWSYVALVRDDDKVKLAIDGLLREPTLDVRGFDGPTGLGDLLIGMGTHGSLNGTLDEIRISRGVARSPDWIRLTYLSASERLLSFGFEERRESSSPKDATRHR